MPGAPVGICSINIQPLIRFIGSVPQIQPFFWKSTEIFPTTRCSFESLNGVILRNLPNSFVMVIKLASKVITLSKSLCMKTRRTSEIVDLFSKLFLDVAIVEFIIANYRT